MKMNGDVFLQSTLLTMLISRLFAFTASTTWPPPSLFPSSSTSSSLLSSNINALQNVFGKKLRNSAVFVNRAANRGINIYSDVIGQYWKETLPTKRSFYSGIKSTVSTLVFKQHTFSEATPLSVTQHSETTPLNITKHSEATPLNFTQHSEATPLSVTQHSEATPLGFTQHSEARPLSVTQDSEATPLAITQHREATPLSITRHNEATPLSVTQISEATPHSVTENSEATPHSVTQHNSTEATPLSIIQRDDTHAMPLPITQNNDTEATPLPTIQRKGTETTFLPNENINAFSSQFQTLPLSSINASVTSEGVIRGRGLTLVTCYLGVVVVVSVACNGLLGCVFYSRRQLLTVSNYFVLNLAVCHLGLSLLVLPFTLASGLDGKWVLSAAWCRSESYLLVVMTVALHYSMLAISLDRNFAIVHSLRYPYVFTHTLGAGVVAGTWVLGLVLGLPPLVAWDGFRFNQQQLLCSIDWQASVVYTLVFLVLVFFLPLLVHCWCYVSIFRAALAHTKRSNKVYPTSSSSTATHSSSTTATTSSTSITITSTPSSSVSGSTSSAPSSSSEHCVSEELPQRPRPHRGLGSREFKAAKTIVLIAAAYFLCWTAYVTVSVLQCWRMYVTPSLNMAASALLFLSCVVNPLIYGFMNRVTRFEVWKLWNRLCQQLLCRPPPSFADSEDALSATWTTTLSSSRPFPSLHPPAQRTRSNSKSVTWAARNEMVTIQEEGELELEEEDQEEKEEDVYGGSERQGGAGGHSTREMDAGEGFSQPSTVPSHKTYTVSFKDASSVIDTPCSTGFSTDMMSATIASCHHQSDKDADRRFNCQTRYLPAGEKLCENTCTLPKTSDKAQCVLDPVKLKVDLLVPDTGQLGCGCPLHSHSHCCDNYHRLHHQSPCPQCTNRSSTFDLLPVNPTLPGSVDSETDESHDARLSTISHQRTYSTHFH